jgi:glycosyltransferase involved in cell wall biosynthesis
MQVFQVVPPVVRDVGTGFEIDQDFARSLKVYLDHFDSIAVACPVRRSDIKGSGLEQCIPMADLPWGPERFKFIPLPMAYEPVAFLKALPGIRRLLRAEIIAAEYLIVTPSGLIGDWPTIAIREAVKLGQPYTIEADGVHNSQMRDRHISHVAWKRFIKRNILFPLADRSQQYCLTHSSLAIFQGQDVFNAYADRCSNPHKLNHHVPVYAGDHITEVQLQAKLDSIARGEPLKICYAGRATDMKGPLDWVDTLGELAKSGVRFDATWLGDGPMLEQMQAMVAERNIPGVTFAGFIAERQTVLDALKTAHVFLFCHKTLESARILGEALACGAPLVGFRTAYPADLVAEHGGGVFCDMGNVGALAEKVRELDRNRDDLATLVTKAARSGRDFDRDAALSKRATLVKAVRPPVRARR